MRLFCREWNNAVEARSVVAELADHEVQVWWVPVPLGGVVSPVDLQCLSEDELERAERIRSESARRQVMGARIALRQMLGACFGVDAGDLAFKYGVFGKPFLDMNGWRTDVRFSVSHSGDLAAIALVRGRDVGLDIEAVRDLDNPRALAGRICSSLEARMLDLVPESGWLLAFHRGWTCKEAYLKATGQGLIDNLADIEVMWGPDGEPVLRSVPEGDDPGRWMLRSLPLPAGYVGAVVCAATGRLDSGWM